MNDLTLEPDLHPSVIEPLDYFGPNDVSENLASIIRAAEQVDHIDKNLVRRLKEICQQIKECKRRVYKWKTGDPSFCSIQATQHSTFLAVTDLFDLTRHIPINPDSLLEEVIEDLERWGYGFDTWNISSLTNAHERLTAAREQISLEGIK